MQTARVDRQSHNLTPRPQWSELRGSARYTSSTATQAAEVCMKNEELQQTISSLRSELAYAEVALAEVKLLQLKLIPLTEHSEKSYISVHLQRINSAKSECWESITK